MAGCPSRILTSRCPFSRTMATADWYFSADACALYAALEMACLCASVATPYSMVMTLPVSVRNTQYAAAILVPCTSRVAHAKSASSKSTFIVTSLADSRLKTVLPLPRKSARPPCGRWRCGSLLTETGHAEEHAPHFLGKIHALGSSSHEV